jgi:hypothetical protein
MADQIVPVTNAPNQVLTVPLSIDGTTITLKLRITYNEIAQYWVMGIADRLGNVLIDSIPLLTGVYPASNLLAQYRYLGIGSAFVINASGTPQDSPDKNTLGSDFVLVWGDTPAL